jgi:hypothetical protein
MPKEFLLNEDKERAIKVVGWFEPDGRITVQVRQYIPDSFFDTVKRMREQFAQRKKGTQSHWLPLPILPSAVADNLLVDGNGKPLALNDPERDKKYKSIQNDIEYRNLRVFEGKV